jgi:hypothetical protein
MRQIIAETLTSVGFTLVGAKAQFDLDKTAFDRVVQEFGTVRALGLPSSIRLDMGSRYAGPTIWCR